ncbi:MAG: tyrosine-type recombinase/integrase [Clostridia bacterium]|nr:tyrosine-type recombinase/integrase [Clostridia bacterium]
MPKEDQNRREAWKKMAKPGSYRQKSDDRIDQKAFALAAELPSYVRSYLTARKANSTARTRLSYLYDLRHFLLWLRDTTPSLMSLDPDQIPVSALASVTGSDIDEYMTFLWSTGNHFSGVHRKFCCLNSFYLYLIRKDLVPANPLEKAERPTKDPSKASGAVHVIKLQPKEIPALLNAAEAPGDQALSLSKRQRGALEKTRVRDYALLTLLLGTGIRVSECAGVNLSDLDLDNCIVEVDRKGDKRQKLALSDEVIDALLPYLEQRKTIEPADPDDADALFLSVQRKRMRIQSIENLVRKYTTLIGTKEHITPHKLRKTYGTELYNETGDIFLVAQALGHSDVNTTKQYYVEEATENLLRNRNAFRMRKKDTSK